MAQIERWFAEITNKRIRRGTNCGTRELVRAIEDYLAVYNKDPKPFVWTKSADNIAVGGFLGDCGDPRDYRVRRRIGRG